MTILYRWCYGSTYQLISLFISIIHRLDVVNAFTKWPVWLLMSTDRNLYVTQDIRWWYYFSWSPSVCEYGHICAGRNTLRPLNVNATVLFTKIVIIDSAKYPQMRAVLPLICLWKEDSSTSDDAHCQTQENNVRLEKRKSLLTTTHMIRKTHISCMTPSILQ